MNSHKIKYRRKITKKTFLATKTTKTAFFSTIFCTFAPEKFRTLILCPENKTIHSNHTLLQKMKLKITPPVFLDLLTITASAMCVNFIPSKI